MAKITNGTVHISHRYLWKALRCFAFVCTGRIQWKTEQIFTAECYSMIYTSSILQRHYGGRENLRDFFIRTLKYRHSLKAVFSFVISFMIVYWDISLFSIILNLLISDNLCCIFLTINDTQYFYIKRNKSRDQNNERNSASFEGNKKALCIYLTLIRFIEHSAPIF